MDQGAFPRWLQEVMQKREVPLWGAADLPEVEGPADDSGEAFPRALVWGVPVHPLVMAGVREGPTAGYAMEYRRLNALIDEVARDLEQGLRQRGSRAYALDASKRTNEKDLCGEFPHKTAATRAGLGWIGRHCQLITRPYGSWVRLGTVLTDAELPCGPPLERSYCGTCDACVRACPAGALTGRAWRPGVPREEILDARACDEYKKQRYGHLMQGRVCGICSAVCPFSRTRGGRAAKMEDQDPSLMPVLNGTGSQEQAQPEWETEKPPPLQGRPDRPERAAPRALPTRSQARTASSFSSKLWNM